MNNKTKPFPVGKISDLFAIFRKKLSFCATLSVASIALMPSTGMASTVTAVAGVERVSAIGESLSLEFGTLATQSTLFTGLPSADSPSSVIAQETGVARLRQFDPTIGQLDSVTLTVDVFGSTTARRSSLCETLLGGFSCGSRVTTTVTTALGASAPGTAGGSFGGPMIGNVPSSPASDVFTTFSDTESQLFAVVGNEVFNPLISVLPGGPQTLTLNIVDVNPYIGTGTVDIIGELWNLTEDSIDCIGALLTCQGFSNVTSGLSWSASADYHYTSIPDPVSPVPLPAGGLLLLSGFAALAGWKKRGAR